MKTIKYITLILGIAIMNAVFAMENYDKPQFSLEFNIYGTGAEIYLNDIPVYHHDTEGQISSQKPIPESIIDGENTLTIKSFPLKSDEEQYQDGAYIEAIISVREKGEPIGNTKPIIQLKINPTQTEDKLLTGTILDSDNSPAIIISHDKNITVASRNSKINSPFPSWAWQNGQAIDNTSDNYDSLLEKYKEIWNALNSGDLVKIKYLYAPAAKEYAAAYYYNNEDEGHRIMNTGGLINDETWGLGGIEVRIQKKKYHLNIYANGKLANIVDDKNKDSLITYLNKKVRMVNFQKFGFYKKKSGEWIMIR